MITKFHASAGVVLFLLTATRVSAQAVAPVPTPQEIADFWDRVFQGPAPYGVPALSPSRTNPRTVSNCTVWNVSFDSYKDPRTNAPLRVGGVLAIPDDIPPPGPDGTYPGIVANHSLATTGITEESAAVYFARRGFAALWYSFRGETYSPIPSGPVDYFTDHLAGPSGEPMDYVWSGIAVDTFQAGEFMAAQPEVWDPDRLTFIGHSAGGFTALAAALFSSRFTVIAASAPAGSWPDATTWLEYAWGNGSFLSIRNWVNAQADRAYGRSLVERSLEFVSMLRAIDNPRMLAKNPAWTVEGKAIWIYGGQTDPSIPPWFAQATYLAADRNEPLLGAFHWSPTGAHGGPESWNRAAAWIAGHYPGIETRPPQAALSVVSSSGATVTLSAAGSRAWRYDWSLDDGAMSADPEDIVSWDYDFGDGTTQNTGPTARHSYASRGEYTVNVTITDGAGLRDSASIQIVVESGSGAIPELAVSAENPEVVPEGGDSTFLVRLDGRPAGNVTVSIVKTKGDPDVSVLGNSTLVFTPSDWATFQTVTLRAEEDADLASSDATFSLSASGIPAVEVNARERDNDARFRLSVGEAEGAPGRGVSLPIRLENPDLAPVASFELSVVTDAAVLAAGSARRGADLPDAAWWDLASVTGEPGTDVISAAEFVQPPDPVLSGEIALAEFVIVSVAGSGVSEVVITSAAVNGVAVNAIENGRVVVSPQRFIRADANEDEAIDISDAASTLGVLFLGRGTIGCWDAADANDDGTVDIADPTFTLGVLFLGGRSLPPPGSLCGADPTEDEIDCKTFEWCQ